MGTSKAWYPWPDHIVSPLDLLWQIVDISNADLHARHSHAPSTLGVFALPTRPFPLASPSQRDARAAILGEADARNMCMARYKSCTASTPICMRVCLATLTMSMTLARSLLRQVYMFILVSSFKLTIIQQEMANPEVAKFLHFYLEHGETKLGEAWQGLRWLRVLPDETTTPCVHRGKCCLVTVLLGVGLDNAMICLLP